jgi:hypothetical protein
VGFRWCNPSPPPRRHGTDCLTLTRVGEALTYDANTLGNPAAVVDCRR